MYILECWIEHPVRSLDQTFTYLSEEKTEPGCRVLVDFNGRSTVGFVESVSRSDEDPEKIEQKTGTRLKQISAVIDKEPLINDELHDLAFRMKEDTVSTAISCFQCILPPKIRPSSSAGHAVCERWVRLSGREVSLTPKQLKAYCMVRDAGEMKYSELRAQFPSIARRLIENGALETVMKEKEAGRTVHAVRSTPLALTAAQKKAIDEIRSNSRQTVLLRGVTGSGKTELYLQLAEDALQEGKQVLILVPEIALTPQMIERVSGRFGEELAIYHSGLNAQEKYEQYRKVQTGRAAIVVGTRSAVFLPFSALGLIVMDEEHDTSYKQDSQPAYHCRDIAAWRASYHHCRLLLGSATPSLDSYARALKGVYGLVELDERVNRNLPSVTIVAMKEELKKGNAVLSGVLKEKIADRLKKNEKCILLLNRRGYSSMLQCRSCGEPLMCPHCELAMSYHRGIRRMKCHFCGTELPVPDTCPSCGSKAGFMSYGFGTERLEMEVQKTFAGVRTLRMDADTTSRRNSHEKILRQFADGKADILLGTQMIAKGLDFPDVTLVGVISADRGLERSDFRSCEATFDLLVQAAGRSGRAEKTGEVIYQVFDPSHYAVQCAARQDYRTFFRMEMQFRHRGQYPPYTYMISMLVQGKDEKKVMRTAAWLRENLGGSYKVIGVIALPRLSDRYRARLILKGKDLNEMRKDISTLLKTDDSSRINLIRIDVNPMVLDG